MQALASSLESCPSTGDRDKESSYSLCCTGQPGPCSPTPFPHCPPHSSASPAVTTLNHSHGFGRASNEQHVFSVVHWKCRTCAWLKAGLKHCLSVGRRAPAQHCTYTALKEDRQVNVSLLGEQGRCDTALRAASGLVTPLLCLPRSAQREAARAQNQTLAQVGLFTAAMQTKQWGQGLGRAEQEAGVRNSSQVGWDTGPCSQPPSLSPLSWMMRLR